MMNDDRCRPTQLVEPGTELAS